MIFAHDLTSQDRREALALLPEPADPRGARCRLAPLASHACTRDEAEAAGREVEMPRLFGEIAE